MCKQQLCDAGQVQLDKLLVQLDILLVQLGILPVQLGILLAVEVGSIAVVVLLQHKEVLVEVAGAGKVEVLVVDTDQDLLDIQGCKGVLQAVAHTPFSLELAWQNSRKIVKE